MSSKKCILFSYGVGGHNAQMNRLVPKLKPFLNDSTLISLSDNKNKPEWSDVHFITGEMRSKYKHTDIFFNLGPIKILGSLFSIRKKYHIDAVVSTGPGISFLSALFFKVFGAKIVHVETWSRFNTRSFTGKLMYLVSDKFYVQNKSLLKLYPKAIYSGLL